jgi:ElaB/YqjD/DUF883 family membrane-anchored ribosome-binding protein
MANTSNAARDAAHDAKETVRGATKATAAAASDIQEGLQALRDDLARLTSQITDTFSSKGNDAWSRARSNIDSVIAEAQDRGMDAVDAARAAGESVAEVLDDSIRRRPYTMLALAAGLGFLFGAVWRR